MHHPNEANEKARIEMNRTNPNPESTSYPFPTVSRLALSLYASARRVERLPRIVEVTPHEMACLVTTSSACRAGDYL